MSRKRLKEERDLSRQVLDWASKKTSIGQELFASDDEDERPLKKKISLQSSDEESEEHDGIYRMDSSDEDGQNAQGTFRFDDGFDDDLMGDQEDRAR